MSISMKVTYSHDDTEDADVGAKAFPYPCTLPEYTGHPM